MAETDPLHTVKQKLFPPLANRTLADASRALSKGRIEIAEPLITKHLRRNPSDVNALNLSAVIARRSGDWDRAEELLARCQGHPGYRFNYAVVLGQRQKFQEALKQIDALLATDHENPLYRDQKAKILLGMGRHPESLALRRELANDYPTSVELWLQYGDVARGAGAQDQCIAALRRVLELSPASSSTYLRLADLQTYRFTAEEIEQMVSQLATPGIQSGDRANLHFALGKAYGDEGSYERSFENYARGNALRRVNVDVDPERLTTHRRNCQSLFTKEFFHERTGWGHSSCAPIFIVGLPRSGSTLVEQILSSHSAVEGLGELPYLGSVVFQHLSKTTTERSDDQSEFSTSFELRDNLLQGYPLLIRRSSADDFRSMGERYLALAATHRTSQQAIFVDKALSNFANLGVLHLMLPNAKIVDIRRHPLDCGWSCFKNYFPHSMPFSYSLSGIGKHYANYVQLMAHFDNVLPGRVHRVVYEDLIADPRQQIARLLEYVGLPFDEQCLAFYENKRVVRTLSSEQVRRPIYKDGIAQWRHYEQWLGPMISALGPALTAYPNAPS